MTPGVAALLLQGAVVTFAAPEPGLRDAQARFESVRRQQLPVEHARAGQCEARIGRFCYWYDSAPPPPRVEAARVTAAREELLKQLQQAAERWPADPWVAGQRVRYLLDAGRADSAAALGCGASPWWCAALRGLALHVASSNAEADAAFSASLSAMPDSVRCAWTNLTIVLEDRVARETQRSDCRARERLAATVWRLGQPLWMTAGRDARSEHLARETMATIVAASATPHNARWGDDMRELLLRYGWAETHTRAPPSGIETSWSVLGHDREPNWNLMPRVASLRAPWVVPDAWSLRGPGARMRYAPRHLTAMLPLPHQAVRIPRGDSMAVAVALRVSDRALAGDTVDAAIAALHEDVILSAAARGGAAVLMVPADTVIVSVEALGRSTRRAARERYSIAPLPCLRAPLCLSDLLLFAGGDSVSLAEALTRPLESPTPAGAAIGVWWHLRGAPGPVTLTLEVHPERSALRRVSDAMRITRPPASVHVRWQARLLGDTASAQLAVRLPENARGDYRLALTAQSASGALSVSERSLEVTSP